jgi:N-hydroxyarylamine O-acetyltransferase
MGARWQSTTRPPIHLWDTTGMSSVDVNAYLQRVGYAGELKPTRAVLESLHLAHATHILFENLDILLGRPVSLDLKDIEGKLVRGGRGGYCFEHNTLFAAVLREAGFEVTTLSGRVRYRASQVLPRTHMLLRVDVEGETCIADVGFGAEGLLLPVPFGAAQEMCQFAWTYRVAEQAGSHVLQSLRNGKWVDLYAFTLEPQHPIDFEMANHYTSTHPNSRFKQTLVVQKLAEDARTSLRNRELVIDRGDATTTTVVDDGDLLATLAETFGLQVPAGTRFTLKEGI